MQIQIKKSKWSNNILSVLFYAVCMMAFTGLVGSMGSRTTAFAAASNTEPEAIMKENPDRVQIGDFVTVHYNLRLSTGELVVTSSQKRAEDPEEKKVDWFFTPEKFGPEHIVAGKESRVSNLTQAVLGLKKGAGHSLSLDPESGFGPKHDEMVLTYPMQKRMPRKAALTAEEFVSQFKKFPTIGQEVNLTPYFKSKVIDQSEASVTLEALAEDGKVVRGEFGDTLIQVKDDQVLITLTPKVGAPFEVLGQKGRIVSADAETFKVDYNHPGAGKDLILEVEVVDFQKASAFNAHELAWIEDYDEGFAEASAEDKPQVLVLYAEWCSWSERLLNETIKDPRVQAYWNDFVWTKVDSDQEKVYNEMYEQKGFPLTLLVDSQGEVIKRLEGFKDASALVTELEQCLHKG